MSSKGLWLTLLLVTTAFTGCLGTDPASTNPSTEDTDRPDPQNLTTFTKVHTPEEANQHLETYDQLPSVDVETIGTSFEDRPLTLATVGTGPFELWVVGRQHGNEPTGGEAILLTIETLADPNATLPADAPAIVHALKDHRETLLDRITFYFLPIANPDGAAAYQRSTALGEDPNRDHYAFTQPSTQAMREAFWNRQPDGCIDLHNEGLGDTDFDAFGPTGPMLEAEPEAQMLHDADLAVREVDAAAGNAGAFNENYRAPAPADDYPNPTAVHPGTHDMFCTTRGAPGWTPEGAIPAGENGIDTPPFAWSTRTHWVGLAATAFHWAGAYDASTTHIQRFNGPLAPNVEHEITLDNASELRLQAVWRETSTESDHNPIPTTFTVTPPNGSMMLAREPAPEQWTSTLHIDDPEPGTYTLSLTSANTGTYELRAYQETESQPLATVERNTTGLTVQATTSAPGPVNVELTDVADPSPADPKASGAASAFEFNGTADDRELAGYTLTLEPGASTHIASPEPWQNPGPYRFTATSGDLLHMGVEDTENPAPD